MKIKIYQGTFDGTQTTSSNLTEMRMKSPTVRDAMEFVDTRMVSTMIVSGVQNQFTSKTQKTKIGTVPAGSLIGDNAYRYRVQGRISRRSVIIAQVGTSDASGNFTLRMRDNLLYVGMVVRFYSGRHARVVSGPVGAQGNYTYSFKAVDGQQFLYATEITPQAGEKTCMGGHTAYGEGSQRGYSRSFSHDEYVNHMSIQRKSIGMTGSALSDITIVEINGKKGWFWTKEQEAKVQFMMEDEYQKWFGISSMKDSNGNLLAQSTLGNDPETGNPIVTGDGVIEQIRGVNDLSPSGSDGMPTIDDFKDMMTMLKKNANKDFENHWYVVTGTDGYVHAQEVLRSYWFGSLGGRTNNGTDNEIEVGANFDTFKFVGNRVTFVLHPMFDDEQLFATLAADGKTTQSGSYIWLNNGFNGASAQRNVEILAKGAYGVNRSMVSNYINGLTGWMDKASTSSVDAMQYDMLKEDMICIYNTQSCGLMLKPAA